MACDEIMEVCIGVLKSVSFDKETGSLLLSPLWRPDPLSLFSTPSLQLNVRTQCSWKNPCRGIFCTTCTILQAKWSRESPRGFSRPGTGRARPWGPQQ